MRGKNLIKLLKALDLLSKPEGTTIEEMAAQLGIDRRSVYRLINVVEELGFPLYDDKIPLEKEKRWKLEESYLKKLPNMKVPDVNLNLLEIISLYLLRSEGSLLKGTELERYTKCIFRSISATHSAPFRPPITPDPGHLLRLMPATHYDPFRPPVTAIPGHPEFGVK